MSSIIDISARFITPAHAEDSRPHYFKVKGKPKWPICELGVRVLILWRVIRSRLFMFYCASVNDQCNFSLLIQVYIKLMSFS